MKRFYLNSEPQADGFAWDSQSSLKSRTINSHLTQQTSSWVLHGILTFEAGMCCHNSTFRGCQWERGVVLGKQTHPWETLDFLIQRESSSSAPRAMRPSLASPEWNETFPPCWCQVQLGQFGIGHVASSGLCQNLSCHLLK